MTRPLLQWTEVGEYPGVVTSGDVIGVSMNHKQGIFWGILAVMCRGASKYATAAGRE